MAREKWLRESLPYETSYKLECMHAGMSEFQIEADWWQDYYAALCRYNLPLELLPPVRLPVQLPVPATAPLPSNEQLVGGNNYGVINYGDAAPPGSQAVGNMAGNQMQPPPPPPQYGYPDQIPPPAPSHGGQGNMGYPMDGSHMMAPPQSEGGNQMQPPPPPPPQYGYPPQVPHLSPSYGGEGNMGYPVDGSRMMAQPQSGSTVVPRGYQGGQMPMDGMYHPQQPMGQMPPVPMAPAMGMPPSAMPYYGMEQQPQQANSGMAFGNPANSHVPGFGEADPINRPNGSRRRPINVDNGNSAHATPPNAPAPFPGAHLLPGFQSRTNPPAGVKRSRSSSDETTASADETSEKRKVGRPKGSKNKPKDDSSIQPAKKQKVTKPTKAAVKKAAAAEEAAAAEQAAAAKSPAPANTSTVAPPASAPSPPKPAAPSIPPRDLPVTSGLALPGFRHVQPARDAPPPPSRTLADAPAASSAAAASPSQSTPATTQAREWTIQELLAYADSDAVLELPDAEPVGDIFADKSSEMDDGSLFGDDDDDAGTPPTSVEAADDVNSDEDLEAALTASLEEGSETEAQAMRVAQEAEESEEE